MSFEPTSHEVAAGSKLIAQNSRLSYGVTAPMWIDPHYVTIPFAVLAGLFSFISPCVLPLVPAYVAYLSAQAAVTVSTSKLVAATAGPDASIPTPALAPSRWLVVLHGLFFVIGFSIVFILIG